MKNHNITFKKINEDDLKLLHQWFQLPHILKWYARDEEYTLKMVEEKYRQRIDDATIPNFIIYDKDNPVGYIQYYHVTSHLPEGITDYSHPVFDEFDPSELIGLDLFIADKNYLHTGFSGEALTMFIDIYLKDKFKAILVDPVKQNFLAISFFEKNGFSHVPSQDDNHDLMLLQPQGRPAGLFGVVA